MLQLIFQRRKLRDNPLALLDFLVVTRDLEAGAVDVVDRVGLGIVSPYQHQDRGMHACSQRIDLITHNDNRPSVPRGYVCKRGFLVRADGSYMIGGGMRLASLSKLRVPGNWISRRWIKGM